MQIQAHQLPPPVPLVRLIPILDSDGVYIVPQDDLTELPGPSRARRVQKVNTQTVMARPHAPHVPLETIRRRAVH